MQEILEQIIDYLKGIWIKRRYIIIMTWLICPIGWFYVSQMPNVYKSDARVYADTQSILGPLLKGLTVQTNPDIQIRLMIRTLLSRPNVERISRMTDLDVQADTPKEYESIIQRLKSHIIIRKSGGRRDNIFTISFQDKDPEMARSVVQSALTVFIENTLGENRTEADAAQKFLNTQIKEYENRLLASEAKLTSFKQKYSGVLPNQYGGYYSKLSVAKEQLKNIELSLLEMQTQLKSAKAQLTASPAEASMQNSKIKNDRTIQTSFDGRIIELEMNLDALQLRYTDKHPDVVEVLKRLENLNSQRDKEIQDYLNSGLEDGNTSNLITSQNPVIQQMQIQVNQLENQVASITVRAKDYRNQVKELESKIHILPEIEAELVALNRGYNITKKKYEEILSRRETALLAQQADETTNKINFRIIDPPRAATEPAGPKRILFFILVTLAAFAIGTGTSLLMSQVNPVATSGYQLTRATGIPIFGMVTAGEGLGLRKWHKKKTLIFVFSNLVLLSILIMLIGYFLFPEFAQAQFRRVF